MTKSGSPRRMPARGPTLRVLIGTSNVLTLSRRPTNAEGHTLGGFFSD
ncbi:MAG: hypothetical protein JO352_09540 [Chloroflexi bacterium]|nr:hypothetical protein [Chloroflexota bacterium]